MVLAELEIFHSRTNAPTRRVALGYVYLPVKKGSGNGAVLLAGIVARFMPDIDEDFYDDYKKLLYQIQRGERISQPRLRHRFQEDRIGLARTVHRLQDHEGKYRFTFELNEAAAEQNILAAAYSIRQFAYKDRPAVVNLMNKAVRWRGEVGTDFISYLLSRHDKFVADLGHESSESWALQILGISSINPDAEEVKKQFRKLLRTTHPDTGEDNTKIDAAKRIQELSEARRILLR
ncbi:MAG: hypothetical protein CL431_04180 [Acidimicrobiaceae bacterium]|jgi:hypothetical protein|nr:hypothetical protein [Acidimicrobiaceae bacterium]|tara:strand:+ start:29601 stop:30302 length:702 start_codon:yes stop_codon:yes gene_type:complete